MAFFKKAEAGLSKLILALAGLGMAAITVIICLQVFFRYVIGSPLAWAEELSLYLEVYVIFLAASYALGKREHVCMDLVISLVPAPVVLIFDKITSVVCLIFSAAMTVYCYNFMMSEFTRKMATLPGYIWMIYLAMVIGFALSVLYSFVLLFTRPKMLEAKLEAKQAGSEG